jgi:pimeloyl-ACP methyl ester carboxylesterase
MDKLTKATVAGIPEGFQELSFTNNGVTLNYVLGPDNGLPLLLIPGQMESWQGYKCVLPELSKRFHVFVPDLRGHGKSTWTPGHYSYNICGNDLKRFIQDVIQQPTLVAGLSSGGVLAIWLAANAPEDVLAIISEDPPIFSSIWPRIQSEKFMASNFRLAVDVLGRPGKRDVEGYLSQVGIPVAGKSELLHIPAFIIKIIFFLDRVNRAVRPDRPYDTPFLPFNMRVGNKFLSEYDTDFSRATIDGDLSMDFCPEETLKRVKCPMLLLRADAYRHETLGLVGAIDDKDLECIVSLVDDLQYVQISGGHEIHLVQPRRYIAEIIKFVDHLREMNKLPSQSRVKSEPLR